jgi:hypothetical protein
LEPLSVSSTSSISKRRRLPRFAAALLAVLALVLVPALPASASGFGSSPIGAFSFSIGGATVQVPYGCFANMAVYGSGKKVTGINANVDCIGPAATIPNLLCNVQGRFRLVDTKGVTYRTAWGTSTNRCDMASATIKAPASMSTTTATSYGQLCVDTYVASTKRATTCVTITT